MSNRHVNVLVVGAGVVGSAVAYHLAEAGATDVLVLDRGAVGQGSSVPVCTAEEECHFAGRSGSSVLPTTNVIKMMVRAALRWGAGVALCGKLVEVGLGRPSWCPREHREGRGGGGGG